MQVTETTADGLRREYRIVVPAAEIDDKVEAKLNELRETVKIDGFRPGKVPVALLRKRFGSSVMGEVLEGVVNDSSRQALEDQAVRPALQPKIEVDSFEAGADLAYKMSVETLPEIEIPDLANYSFTRLKAEVPDSAVDEMIGRLAEDQKSFNEIETARPAATGDMVVIDFLGRIDGTPFDGGAAEDFRLELGAGRFIPGFEDQLLGTEAGATLTVSVTFPDDYPGDEVRGKDAEFEVTVKQLLAPEAVVLDDAFATRLGLEDMAALRSAARGQFEQEYNATARLRLKREILDKLAADHDFGVPEGMVEREFAQIWKQVEDDMERTKSSWAEADQTEEEARADYRGIATRRVRLGLLLSEIGRQNNITVPQDELNRAMMEQARRFPGKEQQIFDYFRNSPDALNELQAPIYEDKVIDFILEMADVQDKEVSPGELAHDPDEDAATEDAATEAAATGDKDGNE
jgi:trigger factor